MTRHRFRSFYFIPHHVFCRALSVLLGFTFLFAAQEAPGQSADSVLVARKCRDFAITGDGSNAAWNGTDWHLLTKLDTFGRAYPCYFKLLYSESGLYVLFNGEDRAITTHAVEDMSNIYEGDAFEVFIFPDTARAVYFEYEINALGKELVMALATNGKKRSAWVPSDKSPGRLDRQVQTRGGMMKPGASLTGWSAELFFSYEMLNLVSGAPPRQGTVWRANFCRLDYDGGGMGKWSWSPGIRNTFHETGVFRSLRFE